MKRTSAVVRLALLSVAVAVLGASPALAQGVGVGAKIGPIFSNLDFTEDGEAVHFDRKTGFMGGIFFGGNRRGLVGVGAEVNLVKKGAKDVFGSDVDLTVLDVPVYLRINGGSKTLSGVSGYFIIGPGFDVNLSAKEKLDGVDIDLKDEVESFDLNLNIGGGIEITRFIVELRYIKGLRNISKELTSSEKVKTKAFALLFGVRFN